MINKFKYIDRGFEKTMVFLPGWASDYRIFSQIELDYNYLHVIDYYPQSIVADLSAELSRLALDKVDLYGYSLGAFKALDFALASLDKVGKVYLHSLRKKYRDAEIKYVKENLLKNKTAYLRGFYKASFANRTKMSWFKNELWADYCEYFELDYLLDTLDDLATCFVDADKLSNLKNVMLYHGAKDSIAPLREIEKLSKDSNVILNVIEDAGHAVFLEEDIQYE